MAYERERKLLRELDAIRVSYKANTQSGDKELVRQWPTSKADLMSSGLTFLNTYGSVDNYPTAKTVVTNPKADTKAYPGTWRVAFNHGVRKKTKPEEQGVYQTLRQGYLESIPSDPADWSEARLVTDRQQQQAGNSQGDEEIYLHAQFKNVSPLKMKSLVAGLNSATFVNPNINNQAYTGTWDNLVVTGKLDEDGAGVIDVIMGDTEYALTAFQGLGTTKEASVAYLYNVPKNLAQGIIDDWEDLNTIGSATTAAYNQSASTVDLVLRSYIADMEVELTGIVTEWSCRYKSTTDYYWGLTEAQANALTLTTPADGETKSLTRTYDASDGSWNVRETTRERQEQTVAEYDNEVDYFGTKTVEEALGTKTASDLPVGAQEDGKIKRRTLSKNDDCTNDIRLEVLSVDDRERTTYTDSFAESSENLLHTENATALTIPTAVAGQIKRNTNRPNRSGYTRTEELTRESKTQSWTSYTESKSESTTNDVETQADNALTAPTAAVGYIRRNTNRETAFGKFHTEEFSREAVDQDTSIYHESGSESAVTTVHTHNSSELTQPTASAGTIKRNTNRMTQFGTAQTEALVRTANDQTSFIYTDSSARRSVITLHTQNSSELTQPTAAVGTIKRSTNTPTDFKDSYRTLAEVITVKDQSVASYTDDFAQSSVSTLHTEKTSPLTSPTASVGTIKRNTNRPTESGKNTTTAEVITVKDQEAIDYETSGTEDVVVTTNTQKTTALTTPTASTGEIRRSTNRPTRAGKYATAAEVRTVNNIETTNYVESGAESVESVTNSAATAVLPDPGASSTGTIKEVANAPTRYKDSTRTTAVTRTAKELDTGWVSYTDRYGTGYVKSVKNATSVDTGGMDATTSNSASVSKNAFKLFDYTLSRRPYSVSSASWDNFEDNAEIEKVQFTTIGGTRKRRTLTIYYQILQTRSHTSAYNFFDVGGDAVAEHQEAHQGSGVQIIGGGRYFRATHLTITDYGLWIDDNAE